MVINGEIFKQTRVGENFYVSASGKMYNIKTKNFLKGSISENGYVRVTIGKKFMSLHRIIFETFNGPIPKNKQIDHIDGNKQNNTLENLRCVTPKENINNPVTFEKRLETMRNEKFRELSRQRILQHNKDEEFTRKRIDRIHKKAHKILRTDLDGSNPKIYDYMSLCVADGFKREHIYECCNGKKNQHHGYKFSYIK